MRHPTRFPAWLRQDFLTMREISRQKTAAVASIASIASMVELCAGGDLSNDGDQPRRFLNRLQGQLPTALATRRRKTLVHDDASP